MISFDVQQPTTGRRAGEQGKTMTTGFRRADWIRGMTGLALIVVGLGLAACGGSDISFSANVKPPEPAKAEEKKPEAVAPPAEVVAEKDYLYTPIGKRDPFRSIFDDLNEENQATPQEEAILSPLQNYPLNTIEIRGILWGVASPTAMVETPDKKSYMVKTGTLIGRNWGRVLKIKQDGIVVIEQTQLPNGQKVTQTHEVKMAVKTIKPNDSETAALEALTKEEEADKAKDKGAKKTPENEEGDEPEDSADSGEIP